MSLYRTTFVSCSRPTILLRYYHGQRIGSSFFSRQSTTTTTTTSTRRSGSFLSFLIGSGSGGVELQSDNVADKAQLEQADRVQKEKEKWLHDDALYRMSVQHAHPLGPWRAMSVAVQGHHDAWVKNETQESTTTTTPPVASPLYRVLDLACGPRGEPGTTIAHLLPLAAIHCTDSSVEYVATVPVVCFVGTNSKTGSDDVTSGTNVSATSDRRQDVGDNIPTRGRPRPVAPPPSNLVKSVLDMSDLAICPSNSVEAITCCYGYGLAPDVAHALSEAYRILVPGGILVIATWERSDMLSIGRDVLETVRGGGRDPFTAEDDEAFLPPRVPAPSEIALAGQGELEALLVRAGFDHPGAVVAAWGTYPFDMGSNTDEIMTLGTILVREELETLGAFAASPNRGSGERLAVAAGGWANLAEEAFWINIRKYTYMVGSNMFLRDNTFKMTVSTKKAYIVPLSQ